eukprot:jgi/Tetstr1/430861/TSEL_002003.t1
MASRAPAVSGHANPAAARAPSQSPARRLTGVASPGRPARDARRSLAPPTAAAGGRSRRSENAAGSFWVDDACISCDTCRWMAPEVFRHRSGQSAVWEQPAAGSSEEATALRCVNACPTGSIHFRDDARGKDASVRLLREGRQAFPWQPPQAEALGLEVYHLGAHHPDSYGAAPWLVRDPATAVAAMIDTPRYTAGLKKQLLDKFGEGQIQFLFLTHADDVADHQRWADALGVQRIIHASEAHARFTLTPDTTGRRLEEAEVQLQGSGPWDPFEGALGPGTRVLHQPGHTRGCCVLHFQPTGAAHAAVFTGDHLAVLRQTGELDAFTAFNKLSHEEQRRSLAAWADDASAPAVRLVLPGHGRMHATSSFPADLREVVGRMAQRMEDGTLAEVHNAN